MTPRLSFFAAGKPEPQGSIRAFVKGGRPILTSDNPAVKQWRDIIGWEARRCPDCRMFDGPVAVTATFWLARPASVSAKRRPFPVVKPDLDKLARALLDAITGVLIRDDAQVCELTALKLYASPGGSPGVAVTVKAL